MVNTVRRSKRLFNRYRNHFARLPPEMLLKIFSNLPTKALGTAARVSSRWSQIVTDTSLWRRRSVTTDFKFLEPGQLGIMLSRGISRLEMSVMVHVEGPLFVDAAPPGGYRLQSLSIGIFLHESDLKKLLSRCSNLKELQIRRLSMSASVFREIQRFTQLEKLDITTSFGGNFNRLLAIVLACPRLTRWRSWTMKLGVPYIMTPGKITTFITELPNTMEDIAFYPDIRSVRDDHIGLLANRCPNINHLDLTRCTNLTAASIEHICSFRKLETLVFRGCYDIPYDALRNLHLIPSLRGLDMGIFWSKEEMLGLQSALPNIFVTGEYIETTDIGDLNIANIIEG